ncbi:MAG: hypothetical protein COV47_01565 [Candidatus Diapherotrites archaeon CG11_big_fil_rev_8_21_14_0_20_37_9]|nr:MAG: hypothetical protein COV47_01565 [Candidatus Diapherotrites archaeon CG11_big_fil_rev_8_21_14_0_20_37_9]
MKLVIDANIFFSAVIKDSGTRKLIVDRRLVLYAPKYLILEFFKYKYELLKKSKLTEEAFNTIFKKLIRRIRIVDDLETMIFYAAAKRLINDEKDAPYVACALAINAEVWSNDRHFSNKRIKTWKKEDLFKKMYKV